VHDIGSATSVAVFVSNFENTSLTVYDSEGNPLISTAIIGTGAKVAVIAGGKETDSATVVIKGDINGDGSITSADYVLIAKHIKSTASLTGAFALACDIDGDSTSSAADYIALRKNLKGN